MEAGLHRVLRGGLIALFPAVPLVVLYRTYHPTEVKDLLFVGLVSLLALGWLRLSMEQESQLVERSALTLALGLNLLVWAATLLLSPYPDQGLGTLSVRLAGVGLLLLTPFYLRTERDVSLAVGLLIAAVAAMSVYGLLQLFRLDPFLKTAGLVGHFRVSSTTDHPNIFISVLIAVVPLTIAAFRFFSPAPRTRALLAVALLLELAAAGATLSRAGWVAMALTLVVTLVGLWLLRGRGAPADGHGREGRSPVLLVVVPLVLVLAGVGLGLSRTALDPGERERLLDLRGPTTAKRLMIYRAGLRMAADSPVVGKGLGTFALFLPKYRSGELARYFPRNEYHVEHAVSEPLEVLVESGGLGLLAWLLLVGLLVHRSFSSARRAEHAGRRAMLFALGAGTLGLVLHGLVEVSLRFQPPLFLLFALPALALALERLEAGGAATRGTTEIRGWPTRLAISVGVGIAFGLVFAMTLSNFVASWRVASGRRALVAGDVARAELAFRGAERAWAGNLPARYRRALSLWRLGHLREAEAEYREVIRRSPYYFDVNHNLARVLYEQGKSEEAARWISVALRINPYHVPSHALAVRIALTQRRLRDAERLARHIVRVAGHDSRAWLALARVRLVQGRGHEARRLLRRALKLDPANKQALRLLRGVP